MKARVPSKMEGISEIFKYRIGIACKSDMSPFFHRYMVMWSSDGQISGEKLAKISGLKFLEFQGYFPNVFEPWSVQSACWSRWDVVVAADALESTESIVESYATAVVEWKLVCRSVNCVAHQLE